MPGRTNQAAFERDLLDLPELPGNSELRDPGLHPEVQLFVANLLTGYLRYAPGRINALVSAYALIMMGGEADRRHALGDLQHARSVFLDSGAITPLLKVTRGSSRPLEVYDWLERTDDIVALAHQLHQGGVAEGLVAALDLPSYVDLLAGIGITVAEAEDLTLGNAEAMLAAELPPGWRPVFTSQGLSIADHERCLAGFERIGVLDAVRTGAAWLAVGGMAFEGSTNRIHVVHRAIRERVGEGHIHALGVSRLEALVPMVARGWVNSADSSSPAQEIRYNRGPYRVTGPRPSFVWESLHAASALYYEAVLAEALKRAGREPLHEQDELFAQAQQEVPSE